ncbi:toll/interleukin-1 receptor domain-containing protein [Novosphingopyxis baekryungensis]|uniref:toll/interleukin-1 receptor domain-containing protein n=1 Tax=Novosphingopyxis baekryungensis TaxID=279369 RepID=UPI0003B525A1|nr:toll/interleukin-1 receptor domain-containing protein [Novosphingopyxis baekryungensis]
MPNEFFAFLAYPRERFELTQSIYNLVTALGVNCWWDKESLHGGDAWDDRRSQALKSCNLFLLVCAPETFNRQGVIQREIREALQRSKDLPDGRNLIVPIIAEEVILKYDLDKFHWLESKSESFTRDLAKSLVNAFHQQGISPPESLEVAATSSTSEEGVHTVVKEENDEFGDKYVSYIQYSSKEEFWSFVNSLAEFHALQQFYFFSQSQKNWAKRGSSSYGQFEVREYHTVGTLVSLTLLASDYYAGTIHPNHSVRTLNILGPENGILAIEELFDNSEDARSALADYITLDLKAREFEPSDQGWIEQLIKDGGWDALRQYNLNERGIIFSLSVASGFPHVFGVQEVYAPWEGFRKYLTETARSFLVSVGMPAESL